MKILSLVIGLLIGFGLTFIQQSGAEQQPIIQTEVETKYITQTELKYVPVNQTEPVMMEITAYTDGPESTGKRPGMNGYGITFSGVRTHPGTCAVDRSIIPLHSSIYIEGLGYCQALDTGSKVRGNHIDYWMESVSDALKFGRQTRKVWILKDY